MPELILLSDDEPVLRCPLQGQSLSVGKSSVNDVSLPDDDAPPFLCTFVRSAGGGYQVASRSGKPLSVNGIPRDEHDLQDGDVIELGRLVARYVAQSPGDRPSRGPAGQRTGILRKTSDGELRRVDLLLRLPSPLGGKTLPIPAEGIRIGANEDNDLVIDDGYVSSFHAQIYLRGERLFVRDLDSTNGTFVGGVKVIEAEVPPSSTIKVGQIELAVVGEETDEHIADAGGEGPWTLGELHTADAGFARVFRLIEKVAAHDATVAVFGETGTGKELVALAIHQLSGRARGPLVPLNCAAIPSNLIESLLFGHEKGAFTGADRQHRGVFEEAHEGTLFLDEVGELPLEMQAKLLRVLETRLVRRVGGRQDIPVDVRIVCATHRDLVKHVAEGAFREDLLHRLYIIPITIPPLRERPADVVHLAQLFAETLSPSGPAKLEDKAREKLRHHPFPGNVRELRNVIQRALILREGETISAAAIHFLPVRLADAQEAAPIYRPGMTLEAIEKQAIQEALRAYGTAAEAARALGLPKSTFWRRATGLGLLNKDKA